MPNAETTNDTQPADMAAFAEALRAAGFQGGIADDEATRLTAATDNSIYQLLPPLVLFPASAADLALVTEVMNRPAHGGVALTPRGAGTGTNGQALTRAVVMDTSRHLDGILEIDPDNRLVRVQPGVVLNQLNSAVAGHGLFFPPHVSTASRATLGGMIGTDACGKGSGRYGRTHDYVESLRVTLADGREMTLRSLTEAEVDAAATPEAALARALRDSCAPYRETVRATFPEMTRSLTGYNLRDTFPADGGVHLQHLVTGAEGTLCLVHEATLRLLPIPAFKRMVVVRYRGFDDALRDARTLLATGPAAIETLDEHLCRLARDDADWYRVGDAMAGGASPDQTLVVNFVEYEADSEAEINDRLESLRAALAETGRSAGHHVTVGDTEAEALWGLRSRSVGMLGRRPGARKPVPFIEDTVVPPQRLPEYIAALRAALDARGIEYGMFGHVDVGCLHVRPALDMTDPADVALVRELTDEVVALLQQHQGILWGEHGKGFRGEYTRAFFGASLYPLLADVKHAFDPANRMNPGKIVAPDGNPDRVDRIDAITLRGELDRQIPAPVRQDWEKAVACNGNGVCFDWDARQAICPSYKITRDRIHSPKGRAALLREWLRRLGEAGTAPEENASQWPRMRRRDAPEDFAHHLFDAMQGCLGCKACATRCPVHVDIPRMRSRFLAAYHRHYRRPVRDYVVGALEHLAPVGAATAPLANAAIQSAWGRALAGRLGLTDLPRFDRDQGRRRLARDGVPVIDAEAATDLKDDELPRTVFILTDAFTTYFDAPVLPALARVIRAAGLAPVALSCHPSGKALHVHGFLNAFHNTALAQIKRLARVGSMGRPVVGVDPSITLTYRDEIAATAGEADWPAPLLPQEWLRDTPLPQHAGADNGRYRLFLHCTECTAHPQSGEQWQAIFRRAGLQLEVSRTGCCGMAGTYGHLAEHQVHSRGLYDLSWREAVEELPPERILATGYSCRSQVTRFSGFRPAHPLEALAAALTPGPSPASGRGEDGLHGSV